VRYAWMKKHKRLFPTTVMCRVLKISTSGHYDSLRRLSCEQLVRRIMRDIGLYSRIKRKFVVTTDSNHALRIAENILNRDFTAKSANQKWAAEDFQDLLNDNKVVCSMSRKGNCWDNACVESFFGNLKAEWVKEKIYETFEDGKKDIFNYIEVFYNRKRRHASLGYVSPVVYEEMHEMKQGRAA